MSERLIWGCLAAVALTIITLLEAIRDYRAIIRRNGERNLRHVGLHAIAIEVIRVAKVLALLTAVYVGGAHPQLRSWIMTSVALAMGLTSTLDLLFRHQMMQRLRVEHAKTMNQNR